MGASGVVDEGLRRSLSRRFGKSHGAGTVLGKREEMSKLWFLLSEKDGARKKKKIKGFHFPPIANQ